MKKETAKLLYPNEKINPQLVIYYVKDFGLDSYCVSITDNDSELEELEKMEGFLTFVIKPEWEGVRVDVPYNAKYKDAFGLLYQSTISLPEKVVDRIEKGIKSLDDIKKYYKII